MYTYSWKIIGALAAVFVLVACSNDEVTNNTVVPRLDETEISQKPFEPPPDPSSSNLEEPEPKEESVSDHSTYALNESKSNNIDSEVVTEGEYGQVSTIIGNGTAGQGEYTTDHPRFPAVDSKGNIYFIDGSQKTAKLRMFNGEKNTTVIDLRKDKVTRREGEFFHSGLVIINDTVYFSSEEKVYKLVDDRATELDPSIKQWMKDNQYEYVYRMEQYEGDLVLMLWSKNWTHGFIKYDLDSKEIEELLPAQPYDAPTNFTILPQGILVSTESGNAHYEQFFPRQTITVVNTSNGIIKDVWMDKNKTIYYSIVDEKNKRASIHTVSNDTGRNIGFALKSPTDFTWDGEGYVFSDGNELKWIKLDRPISEDDGKLTIAEDADTTSTTKVVSETVKEGEYGQVSTIIGNGTRGQGEYTLDRPRYPGVDSKGNVYFLDGQYEKSKLRMFNGKRNTKLVDLGKDSATKEAKPWTATGLAVIDDVVYFSSKNNLYRYSDGKVIKLPLGIEQWIFDNWRSVLNQGWFNPTETYIYRMEQYKDDLILMIQIVDWGEEKYSFFKYDIKTGATKALLEPVGYNDPNSFQALPEGILVPNGGILYDISTLSDYRTLVDTNEGIILDAWVDEDKNVYYSIVKDRVYPHIRIIPQSEKAADNTSRYNDPDIFAGSTIGFTDGIMDQAQLDYPTDFIWDGSGYIFADVYNNAIRKLWLDSKPLGW
jgi:hypothetical protein